MESQTIRVVRDGNGQLLMKWVTTPIAEICEECSTPIDPHTEMAVWSDEYVHSAGAAGHAELRHIKRTYCKPCGELLEDSVITTEAE